MHQQIGLELSNTRPIAHIARVFRTLDLAGVWPTNLPPGVQLWMQVWIVDPTAPLGLSATNGLLAATP